MRGKGRPCGGRGAGPAALHTLCSHDCATAERGCEDCAFHAEHPQIWGKAHCELSFEGQRRGARTNCKPSARTSWRRGSCALLPSGGSSAKQSRRRGRRRQSHARCCAWVAIEEFRRPTGRFAAARHQTSWRSAQLGRSSNPQTPCSVAPESSGPVCGSHRRSSPLTLSSEH